MPRRILECWDALALPIGPLVLSSLGHRHGLQLCLVLLLESTETTSLCEWDCCSPMRPSFRQYSLSQTDTSRPTLGEQQVAKFLRSLNLSVWDLDRRKRDTGLSYRVLIAREAKRLVAPCNVIESGS